ncbi:Crp/Fnr family transcriptional regulator [Methylobacterium sp. J-030]|uniref:Crp/Fnr family transcriptional regulator n=1 Tax=Methylobacterium sp. J-030 TaxID=2836627 RepID=UPI001FB9377A|nr:Crp/Fnr family transcriptional regulator [Methylobacterium sp. J-030]MCJ2068474.1 Crp/Fnr family transcriptional regulator [Methylobacterium sp. J-030]
MAEGDYAARTRIILDGWACRWKGLPNGQRQITELLLPGDICHAHSGMLLRSDHSIATLSTCIIAEADPTELTALLKQRPMVRQALRWSSLQTNSILRTALVNNGLRQADQRLAHFICEIWARLQSVGLAKDGAFSWPLTQIDVGEIASMTSVHVNRTLGKLRRDGLITLHKRRMSLPDMARLAESCDFRPDYLHLKAELGSSDP